MTGFCAKDNYMDPTLCTVSPCRCMPDSRDARIAELPAILEETTQLMASHCTVSMNLWDRHSNACLDAAKHICDLRSQLAAREPETIAELQAEIGRLQHKLYFKVAGRPGEGATIRAAHSRDKPVFDPKNICEFFPDDAQCDTLPCAKCPRAKTGDGV